MRTLKRPMFRIGGKAEVGNEGIMSGLVDREELQAGTALQKFQSIGDIQEIMPYNMSGAEIKDMYNFDFPINLKSTFIAENPKPQNIKTTSEGDIFYTGSGKPEFKKKPDKFYPGQEDPQGSQDEIVNLTTGEVKELLKPKDEALDSGTAKIGGEDKDTGSNNVTQAEKNAILKARAREFEELLNPGARKRVINNAWARASEQFGKSTGNTMQDIANAITAAAGATGEMDKTKQKAAELAIGESIQKGIAKEKAATTRPNATQSLINFYREAGLDDKEIANKISKTSESELDYIRAYPVASQGKAAYVSNVESKNIKDFGGVLSNDKKQREEELKTLDPNKIYYDSARDAYVKIKISEGKATTQIVTKR